MNEGEGKRQAAYAEAQAVKRAHEGALLNKPNVVLVGVGLLQKDGKQTDAVALVVMVKEKVPPEQLPLNALIPAEIDGVPVDVQEGVLGVKGRKRTLSPLAPLS